MILYWFLYIHNVWIIFTFHITLSIDTAIILLFKSINWSVMMMVLSI